MNTNFDGFVVARGMDGSTNPIILQSGYYAHAVNRAFRGYKNRTRPPFKEISLTFDSQSTESAFRNGAVQGAIGFRAVIGNPKAKIVVAVGGRLIAIEITGSTGIVKTIREGLEKSFMKAWFVQVEDRIYMQDGANRPLGWDGVKEVYEIADDGESMPVGTAMAYAQGRLAVTTADNKIIISDHIYGSSLADTRGTEKFTEFQQYNDIGAFVAPSNLGPITGIAPIPQPGTVNAQGPLMVMCSNGAIAIDTSRSRDTWLTGNVQTTIMLGRGGCGHSAIIPVNDDVWFITSDGIISSYRFEQSFRGDSAGDVSMSTEVDKYMSLCSKGALQFASMVKCDNRILATTAIQISQSTEGGIHRYALGMVALDLYQGSNKTPTAGLTWDGLWTGIQPTEMVNLYVDGHQRTFAFSFKDGVNSLYEICSGQGDDYSVEHGASKIESQFDMGALFAQREFNQMPVNKRAKAVSFTASEVFGKCSASAKIRPVFYPKWAEAMSEKTFGIEPDGFGLGFVNFGLQYAEVQGESIKPTESEEDTYRLMSVASGFMLRMECKGSFAVEMVQLEAQVIADTKNAADGDKDTRNRTIRDAGDNYFTYKIP